MKQCCKILSFFFLCLSLPGCLTTTGFLHDKPPTQVLRRPFRMGILKMAPDLDAQKPLAPQDNSGWIHAEGFLIGNPEASVAVAYSLKKDTRVWTHVLPGGPLTTPALSVGKMVILAQQDGTVEALETATGALKWQIKLPNFVPVPMSKDREHIYVLTANQVVYAIGARDGKIEWLYDPEIPLDLRIHNSAAPLVSVNQLYIGLSSGELLCLDIQSGKKVWRRNPKIAGGGRFHNFMGRLAVSNKHLAFCRYDGLIGAVSLEPERAGELLWQQEASTGNCMDADFRNGKYYSVTSSGEVFALNAESGQNLWSGIKLGTGLSTISITEEHILITGTDGKIYALTERGALDWYDDIDGRLTSPPLLLDGAAYFSSGMKNIYVYRYQSP